MTPAQAGQQYRVAHGLFWIYIEEAEQVGSCAGKRCSLAQLAAIRELEHDFLLLALEQQRVMQQLEKFCAEE